MMTNQPGIIYHITSRSAWEQAQQQGYYTAPSLESEGFIHASTREQVLTTAQRFYQGQRGLVLLEIDTARLSAPLRYDAVPEHGTFPHLYGTLNLDAVQQVHGFEPDSAGNFDWPANP